MDSASASSRRVALRHPGVRGATPVPCSVDANRSVSRLAVKGREARRRRIGYSPTFAATTCEGTEGINPRVGMISRLSHVTRRIDGTHTARRPICPSRAGTSVAIAASLTSYAVRKGGVFPSERLRTVIDGVLCVRTAIVKCPSGVMPSNGRVAGSPKKPRKRVLMPSSSMSRPIQGRTTY